MVHTISYYNGARSTYSNNINNNAQSSAAATYGNNNTRNTGSGGLYSSITSSSNTINDVARKLSASVFSGTPIELNDYFPPRLQYSAQEKELVEMLLYGKEKAVFREAMAKPEKKKIFEGLLNGDRLTKILNTEYRPAKELRDLDKLLLKDLFPNYELNSKDLEGINYWCKQYGIKYPERFNSRNELVNIINWRYYGLDKDKPVALMLYPKSDWNGAFENNQITELIAAGYQIGYYELGRDTEIRNAFAQVGGQRKIDLVVLAGHGTQTDLQLTQSRYWRDEDYIDFSDAREFAGLDKYLAKDATIVLHSCSTGSGGQYVQNLANFMSGRFPGRTVFAPDRPTNERGYIFDQSKKLVNISYYYDAQPYAVQTQYA
ncbi:hypothetical protein HP1_083 [Candidatus Termititenax spirochaetophilus]|uniref:DUF4347 domain-containing protein n=1 Tax=Candidatus Termititenax spirochaetophilus TaxID=2218522 RepID=A0A388T6P4_9BACT|nr:hypothetical protein HP1_083 [Candidatus Termititenax spirochaetophilus]